jgi:hypothetical protein
VLSPTTRDRIERNDVEKGYSSRYQYWANSSIDGGTGTAGAPDIVIDIIHPKCNCRVEYCLVARYNYRDGTNGDDETAVTAAKSSRELEFRGVHVFRISMKSTLSHRLPVFSCSSGEIQLEER